jgi:hypothetical protein
VRQILKRAAQAFTVLRVLHGRRDITLEALRF